MTSTRKIEVAGVEWRYQRLGDGPALLWLTGGLRRAAVGQDILDRLAAGHTVIAPDYPPIGTFDQFLAAIDSILDAEHVGTVAVVGQSYGGLLAQAYLSQRPDRVGGLVLSSSGPAGYGWWWLPVEYLAIGLLRVLPESLCKAILVAGLGKLADPLPPAQRDRLRGVIERTIRDELARADAVSHFALAANIIRTRAVDPEVLRHWRGRVVVLRADNDVTQRPGDLRRFRALFGRDVEVMGLGALGHAAGLSDPDAYHAILERALD